MSVWLWLAIVIVALIVIPFAVRQYRIHVHGYEDHDQLHGDSEPGENVGDEFGVGLLGNGDEKESFCGDRGSHAEEDHPFESVPVGEVVGDEKYGEDLRKYGG